MAAVKWYLTDTNFSGLTGYFGETADNEKELSTTAPSSGTVSASIAKGSNEQAFVGGSDAAPHASTHRDWSVLAGADSQISVDVNSTHADLTLTSAFTEMIRFNSSGTEQVSAISPSDGWDSNSGTGVKVWTPVGVDIALGIAATTDRIGMNVGVTNGGHMNPQTIVFNLGSSTYVEFAGGAPASLSLVCGAECQIHNTGSGAAADSHWGAVTAGDGSTPDSVATQARSGSRSLRFLAHTTNGTSYLRHTATDTGFDYFRGYFYLPDVGPANETTVWRNDTAATAAELVVTTGGVLRLIADTTYSSTNDLTLSVDTWYGVEVEVEDGVGAKWRVWDGSWSSSETVADAGVTGAGFQELGLITDVGAADRGTFDVYWDDTAIGFPKWAGGLYDDTGTNGVSGKVLRYNPTSDGTHNITTLGHWQYDGTTSIALSATDVHTYLDDGDMEGTSDWVNTDTGVNGSSYVEVAFGDEASEDDPRGVSLVYHFQKTPATSDIHRSGLSDDGSTFDDHDITTGSSVADAWYQRLVAEAPNGGAWTRALVNSIEVRLGTGNAGGDIGQEFHQVALEVEWTSGATTVNGSFTADGIVKAGQSGSFTADAIIEASSGTKTFTADAEIVAGAIEGSFTADAIVEASMAVSLTADAVIEAPQTATFTADAIVLKAASASLTVDAVVERNQVASLTANAILKAEQTATFTADAIVEVIGQADSAAADAVILRAQPASATADAVILATMAGSATADAVILATIAGSFTADAITLAVQAGSVSADAVIEAPQTGSVSADATIMPVFTIDAVALETQAATLTADAIVMPVFTIDAEIVPGSVFSSFDADAIFLSVITSSLTADAITERTQTTGVSADAVTLAVVQQAFVVDAVLKAQSSQSFTADAVVLANVGGSFTADAVVMPVFTADAVIWKTIAGAVTADAVVMPVFTIDAVVSAQQSASFSATAWIAGAGMAAFAIDAVVLSGQTGSFAADAVVLSGQLGSHTAEAVIQREAPGSFSADAQIFASVQVDVQADAIKRGSTSSGVTADAVARVPDQTGGFTTDAVRHLVVSEALSQDAVLRAIQAESTTLAAITEWQVQDDWTASAWIHRNTQGSLLADAIVFKVQTTSFSAAAWIEGSGIAAFAIDAVVRAAQTKAATADAVVQSATSGSFDVAAVVQKPTSSDTTANAILHASLSDFFVIDAVVFDTQAATFTIDSRIAVVVSGGFTAEAIIDAEQLAGHTADAILLAIQTASATADAVVRKGRAGALPTDAVLSSPRSGSVLVDAWLTGTVGSFTADAFIETITSGAFYVDAVLTTGALLYDLDAITSIPEIDVASTMGYIDFVSTTRHLEAGDG